MSRHDKNIICEDEDADIRESRRERERERLWQNKDRPWYIV